MYAKKKSDSTGLFLICMFNKSMHGKSASILIQFPKGYEVAEKVGFEPTWLLSNPKVFETWPFDRSGTSPLFLL